MAEVWFADGGLWKRNDRLSISPAADLGLSFMPAVQMHAVWDRTGTAFGAIHIDILTKLKAMGTKAVRIDTSWAAWEPTQGNFASRVYSGKLDDTLSWLNGNGMKALVTINESPSWAAAGVLRRLPTDPTSAYNIGQYITEYLRPWSSVVVGVEFWNEPNLIDFDDLGPRPDHYVDCLHQFWLGAKAGDAPDIPIVFGAPEACSVAPVGSTATSLRNHFISFAYDRMNTTLGGLRPYDVMAFHCYPGNELPNVASTGTQFWRLRHFEHLRARMALENDNRPVFITEMGYSAHANTAIEAGAQPPWQIGVTDADQATLTTSFYDYVAANYPEIKMVSCYNEWEKGDLTTVTTYANRHQYGFGILKFTNRATTKPIYSALSAKFPTLTAG